MRMKVASTLAMAVTSALFMTAAPAPSIAGGRALAGFGIGVVVSEHPSSAIGLFQFGPKVVFGPRRDLNALLHIDELREIVFG